MKRMRTTPILLATAVTLLAHVADAQTRERLLVPVLVAQPVAGAHGSVWTTELVARNLGPTGRARASRRTVVPPDWRVVRR